MKTHSLSMPIIAAVAALAAGCTRQERAEAGATARDALADTKAALSDAWSDVKTFTYEKKEQFTTSARAMTSKMDAQIAELRADYSEAKASASRKAAMEELRRSEADYKTKLDALGRAGADTWDAAKQNVIAAWERLEASYRKARAEK